MADGVCGYPRTSRERQVTISVALRTHNGAQFIETQLQCSLDQTTLPDEIVISNDASTDGTIRVTRSIVENGQSRYSITV